MHTPISVAFLQDSWSMKAMENHMKLGHCQQALSQRPDHSTTIHSLKDAVYFQKQFPLLYLESYLIIKSCYLSRRFGYE